jgi:hypothetical protein
MRFPVTVGASVVVISILAVGSTFSGDAVDSGLKAGEPVNPFDVQDVTGPNKGATLCYR